MSEMLKKGLKSPEEWAKIAEDVAYRDWEPSWYDSYNKTLPRVIRLIQEEARDYYLTPPDVLRLKEEDLRDLKEKLAKATKGEWTSLNRDYTTARDEVFIRSGEWARHEIAVLHGSIPEGDAARNAEFIVASHNLLPDLLHDLEQLHKMVHDLLQDR